MEADLLAAVYAAPLDDAPRLVYADWLQDRGDPRGEFIALQLAGRDASALLAEDGAQWLGDLPASDVAWERGFPSSCRPLAGADPRDPRWRTLTALGGTSPLSDVVELPALRRLFDLTNDDMRALGDLVRPLVVETIAWDSSWSRDEIGREAPLAKLRQRQTLPHLRRLELVEPNPVRPRVEGLTRILEPGCFARIEELAVFADLSYLHEWYAIDSFCAPFRRTATDLPLNRIELRGGGPHGWRAHIARDAKGLYSELGLIAPPHPPAGWLQTIPRPYGEVLLAGLGALPRTQLTTARIAMPDGTAALLRAPLERALAKQVRLATLEFV